MGLLIGELVIKSLIFIDNCFLKSLMSVDHSAVKAELVADS